MTIFCNFFQLGKFGQLRILRERASQKSPKKSSKTGDRFTATSALQNNVEHVLFQAGNRELCQTFLEKVYSPQIPKNWE